MAYQHPGGACNGLTTHAELFQCDILPHKCSESNKVGIGIILTTLVGRSRTWMRRMQRRQLRRMASWSRMASRMARATASSCTRTPLTRWRTTRRTHPRCRRMLQRAASTRAVPTRDCAHLALRGSLALRKPPARRPRTRSGWRPSPSKPRQICLLGLFQGVSVTLWPSQCLFLSCGCCVAWVPCAAGGTLATGNSVRSPIMQLLCDLDVVVRYIVTFGKAVLASLTGQRSERYGAMWHRLSDVGHCRQTRAWTDVPCKQEATALKVQRFWRPEDISRDAGYRAGFWDIYAGSSKTEEVDFDDIIGPCTILPAGSTGGALIISFKPPAQFAAACCSLPTIVCGWPYLWTWRIP